MEELFVLVYFGNMYYDISRLTGEERSWWINRLKRQKETEREAAEK